MGLSSNSRENQELSGVLDATQTCLPPRTWGPTILPLTNQGSRLSYLLISSQP